jgi:hypothetical protein
MVVQVASCIRRLTCSLQFAIDIGQVYRQFRLLPRYGRGTARLDLIEGLRDKRYDPALGQLGVDLRNLIDFRTYTLEIPFADLRGILPVLAAMSKLTIRRWLNAS